MKTLLTSCFILFTSSIMYAQSNNNCNIQIAFEHMIRNEIMEFEKEYQNDFGEKFTIRSFKYYVSNIGFEDDSGKISTVSADIFLIDESSPESKRIALNIPPGKYKSIRFTIGVDSTHSVDGVHEGALDPYQGMFWTWNTGFVSAKLEGTSPVSTMPKKVFEYHIGGYRAGQNSLRTIVIPLDNDFKFESRNNTMITIKADICKWFNAKNRLKIAQKSFVHNPGDLALQYADNYASMFSLLNMKRY